MKFNLAKVVFCGDSLVDENTNKNVSHSDSSVIPYEMWDSSNHWSYLLSRVLKFDYTNTAVCGEQIKNIYNSYLNERILKYNPTLVILDGGVNDVGNAGTSPDDASTYMKNTIQTLLDNGIQVGLLWFPVDSSKFGGSTKGNLIYMPAKYEAMSQELEADYPEQFVFLNFEGVTNFGTTSTGPSTIPQAYRRDGLHFNRAGYRLIAEYILKKMNEMDDTLNASNGVQAKAPSSVIIRG